MPYDTHNRGSMAFWQRPRKPCPPFHGHARRKRAQTAGCSTLTLTIDSCFRKH